MFSFAGTRLTVWLSDSERKRGGRGCLENIWRHRAGQNVLLGYIGQNIGIIGKAKEKGTMRGVEDA